MKPKIILLWAQIPISTNYLEK